MRRGRRLPRAGVRSVRHSLYQRVPRRTTKRSNRYSIGYEDTVGLYGWQLAEERESLPVTQELLG